MWWCREVEGNKVEGFLSLALNQKIEKADLHFANRVFCFRAIVIAEEERRSNLTAVAMPAVRLLSRKFRKFIG
jgi:hypothetical protein